MVRSGLDEQTMANANEPRVSQYRLAAHLGLAFTVYAGLFHNALSNMLKENKVNTRLIVALHRKKVFWKRLKSNFRYWKLLKTLTSNFRYP